MSDLNTLQETAVGIESIVDHWSPRLRDLAADQVSHKPTPDRWSIAQLIGHLIDSASNNHQRFVRAQYCDGELIFPKYDQNQWVAAADYANHEWDSIVELWVHYNLLIASVIRSIQTESLQTPCTITPYETCTLEFLVTDYLAHLHHHFKILEERLA